MSAAASSDRGRALIVGGGIGGLATAHALLSHGIDAVVFERADDIDKIQLGGGFHMWANASRALQRLGLYDQVQAIGAPLDVVEYRTSRGRLLATWPVDELAREHGVVDVGVSRQDLQTLLVEAVGAERLRLGAVCTGFQQDDDGVRVEFADGSREQGSLLVAADGLHSVIRAQIHGQRAPRYAGYTQWQSLIEDHDQLLQSRQEQVLFGPGARAVLHHVGGDRLFWAVVLYGDASGPETRADRDELVARFAGWHGSVEAAIAATAQEQIAQLQIYDREPIASWGVGRVTLLGDAAHPMTTNLSQGVCQVLEDAAMLGRCVQDVEDIELALKAYEQARIARTTTLVNQSSRIARAGAWRRPLTCAVRDRLTALILGGPGLKAHRQLAAADL